MEEMTEVDFEGKKYVWDGTTWCEAKTYTVPPDNVINKLNAAFRAGEAEAEKPRGAGRAPARPRVRKPAENSGPRRHFVPASLANKTAPAPPPPVERITAYDGDNAFLAMDFPTPVWMDGQSFPSAWDALEHARQHHARLRLNMQREWDEKLRGPLMRKLIKSKYAQPAMRAALLATGEKHLSHQADGADPFWHAPGGEGENTLGRMTMDLRARMRKHYCLLNDEQIVEDLKEHTPENPLVPDEAIARDCCWKRITELADLYKEDLPKGLKDVLGARRAELLAQTDGAIG